MSEEHNSGAGARRRKKRRGRSSRHLPEELQEEILRRLPVKSLTRFESVCKTWGSKFHSRRFIDLYGRRNPVGVVSNNNNSSLELHTVLKKELLERATGLKYRKIKAEERWNWRRVTRVFGPLSNGIYCLTSHHKSLDRFCILSGKIALCNPSIHDYKFTNPFSPRIRALLDNIASKPCRLYFGFGQIDSSLDYRVVVIVHYGKSFSSFLSFVYSLQSGKWKKIVDYKYDKRKVGHRKATEAFYRIRIAGIEYPFEVCPQRFCEGCWHWTARSEDESYYVLSFNFADEAFKLIGAPSRYNDESFHFLGSVFVLHDHLAFIYLFSTMLPQRVEVEVDVWMMMEYGVEKSWIKIYKINPNFYGRFMRLVGIDYTPRRRDEESGGVIRIKRLFFQDDDKYHIISCDDAGSEICEESGLWNISTKFFWNTPGISTYVETLERF